MNNRLGICDANELNSIDKIKDELRKFNNDNKIVDTVRQVCNIVTEDLIVTDYNLYWEKNLLTGDLRGWPKSERTRFTRMKI